MSRSTIGCDPKYREWNEFAQRHAGNSFLKVNPLYSLSEPIIDAIVASAPQFFTSANERFERDLAKTVSFGFFYRRALGLNIKDIETCDSRHQRSEDAIKQMLNKEFRQDGVEEGEIRRYWQRAARRREIILHRMEAYSGWLISNPIFRNEVRDLKKAWEAQIKKLGFFPRYPRWLFLEDETKKKLPPEAFEEFLKFYRRWGLDHFLTWDWPVPMEPDLVGGLLNDLDKLTDAGMMLFIPWYLLRGEKLNLQEVAHAARTGSGATHLFEWLKIEKPEGDIHFRNLQWVYRYYELVLKQRYGKSKGFSALKLDGALGVVIKRENDTVKKLRLKLQKALSQ